MVLYSIVDISDVLVGTTDVTNSQKTNIRKIKGGFIERDTVNGSLRVKRLYSTNPALYLDKRYYPF